ncbi:MAG: TetR/AcrR family transcriptional regulator, partial [Kibdelosporangium sp.]
WGAGGKQGLSLARIVRAAIDLADAEGLSAVSMRRVAERLGFTTMSLYRHVPSKADLVALMREEALGATDISPDESLGWRTGLERWARDGLALYQRHPWLTESAATRIVPGPNAVAGFERALNLASRAGLAPFEVVAAVTLLGGFVESAARQTVEMTRTERRSGVSHEEWWGARDSLYAHLDQYPTLTRLYAEGAYDTPADPFEFGLQRVLDGIATLVRDDMRDENACLVCGTTVETTGKGRPREYCSRACQQRAYRARQHHQT